MALIKCGECGRQVSDQASSCPSCGAPVVLTETQSLTMEGMINCPFCKESISDTATICGHCGAEYGYRNLLNDQIENNIHLTGHLIAILVMGVLVFFLAQTAPFGALLGGFFLLALLGVLPKTIISKINGKKWWR